MKISVSVPVLVILSSLAMACAQTECPPMGESNRANLVDYVHKKYNVPSSVLIEVSRTSFVGSTCYQKLLFQSTGSSRTFHLELFISPDFRFLSRDLMDSLVDPVEEQRKKDEELFAGLTHGEFPALGPKDAPVTLTVFSDFQCPYCAQLAKGLESEIMPAAGGKARIVFRHFPLAMHPWARPAAEAAACTWQEGEEYFWRVHGFVFQHQRELTPGNVQRRIGEEAAGVSGFDPKKFGSCLDDRKMAAAVERDIAFGREIGVTGTPTLFINAQRVVGYRPEQILTLIRQMSNQQLGGSR